MTDEPLGPAWSRPALRWTGIRLLQRVTELELEGPAMNDQVVPLVQAFRQLEVLRLGRGCSVSEAGLARLRASLPQVRIETSS